MKKSKKQLPFSIINDFEKPYIKHMTADFETCDTPDRKDVRVWAWGLADILTEDFEHGTDIDSFMGRLLNDTAIYDIAIHNLKFDGNFILPWLYKHGYNYLDNKSFMDKWLKGEDLTNTFTHNITVMGQWFNLMVVKPVKSTPKTPSFVYFWDSLKLFPQTLKEVGEQYCKTHQKLDENQEFYDAIRPLNHTLTKEELSYLKEDCLVLAEALQQQIERYGKIYRTRASKAFSFFKECCFDAETNANLYKQRYEGYQQYIVPEIEGLEDVAGTYFRYLPYDVKQRIKDSKKPLIKAFEYYIPSYAVWCDLKGSYRGGIAYVDDRFKEQSINGKVTVIDVNSMYPACLAKYPMPFGRMRKRKGVPPSDKLWIACARISFKIKDEWRLPCIQIKELYGREWLKYSTDIQQYGEFDKYNEDYLTFTSVDYETFKENYDFIVHEWLYYYEFANSSNQDGKRFVDKYYGAKQHADATLKAVKAKHNKVKEEYEKDPDFIHATLERLESKVIMNSAYGKFGTKYILSSKDTYFDKDTGMVHFTGENHTFNKEPEDPSHYYLPYASFTTSYARQMLVRAWASFKGKAVYCDTDSIYFLGGKESVTEELSPVMDWNDTGDLGLWGIEGEFIKARFIRAKTYIAVKPDGENKIVCAGATKDVKKVMDWENFRVGFDAWQVCKARGLDYKHHSKLKPKQYPNGVKLDYENFQIKP